MVEELRVRVKVPNHSNALANFFNKLHVEETRADETSRINFNVRCVDFERIVVNHNNFEDYYNDCHLHGENPQSRV